MSCTSFVNQTIRMCALQRGDQFANGAVVSASLGAWVLIGDLLEDELFSHTTLVKKPLILFTPTELLHHSQTRSRGWHSTTVCTPMLSILKSVWRCPLTKMLKLHVLAHSE